MGRVDPILRSGAVITLTVGTALAGLGFVANGWSGLTGSYAVRESGLLEGMEDLSGSLYILAIRSGVYLLAGIALLVASPGLLLRRNWARGLFERLAWYGVAWTGLMAILILIVSRIGNGSESLALSVVERLVNSMLLCVIALFARSTWLRREYPCGYGKVPTA